MLRVISIPASSEPFARFVLPGLSRFIGDLPRLDADFPLAAFLGLTGALLDLPVEGMVKTDRSTRRQEGRRYEAGQEQR